MTRNPQETILVFSPLPGVNKSSSAETLAPAGVPLEAIRAGMKAVIGKMAAAVADAVDVVDDGPPRVAGEQEVGVQRVDGAVGRHRLHRRRQRLPPIADEQQDRRDGDAQCHDVAICAADAFRRQGAMRVLVYHFFGQLPAPDIREGQT